MMNSQPSYRHLWLPLLIGIVMLPIPLLGDFHIESALAASLAGCFWGGWKACQKITSVHEDRQRLGYIFRAIYLVGAPLFLFALFTGCFSWNGLAFWLLYPAPAMLFGYAIGRFIRCINLPFTRTITMLILCWVAVGVLAVEFFTLPQVYFFNHVWGGWPGPIYDETVTAGRSLVFFRGLTLAWVGLLWVLTRVKKSIWARIITALCTLGLIAGYTHLPEMGITSPRSYVQKQLGGIKKTPHFIIYYDKKHFSADDIGMAAREHEFYFHQISKALALPPRDTTHKIESYLYAHAWQKKRLVGAKFTSYVPVWLKQDQLHIAKQQLDNSLKHELVHVMAKPFGNSLIHASWSIGLTEGLAVALAPDESPVSTINQIVGSQKPYPTAQEMQQSLSPLGFYGGRATVNYTTSGSFVRYLLHHYPVKDFKKSYRSGHIAGNYPVPFDSLIKGWHNSLSNVEVDSTDRKTARRLFSFPSLFEQKCPHVQSLFAQHWDQYHYHLANGDTIQALQELTMAKKLSRGSLLVKATWTFQQLKAGHLRRVVLQTSPKDSSLDLQLLYADAFMMERHPDTARSYLAEAQSLWRQAGRKTLSVAIKTRLDSLQWRYYRQLMYHDSLAAGAVFHRFIPRSKILAVEKAIKLQQWDKLEAYTRRLLNEPLHPRYFDTYLSIIRWLGYLGELPQAKAWIKKLHSLPLRPRYQQRLEQHKDWIQFLETHPS